jgi:hypothetical protein
VVELHLTVEELRRYGTDPELAEWAGVLAEIAGAWADRDRFRRRLAADPRARFARGALADHVRIRDRNCCEPGCTRPARRSDLDQPIRPELPDPDPPSDEDEESAAELDRRLRRHERRILERPATDSPRPPPSDPEPPAVEEPPF